MKTQKINESIGQHFLIHTDQGLFYVDLESKLIMNGHIDDNDANFVEDTETMKELLKSIQKLPVRPRSIDGVLAGIIAANG